MVPANGLQATTLQGALLLAVHRLWVELFNRGGSDWEHNQEQYQAQGFGLVKPTCLAPGEIALLKEPEPLRQRRRLA